MGWRTDWFIISPPDESIDPVLRRLRRPWWRKLLDRWHDR